MVKGRSQIIRDGRDDGRAAARGQREIERVRVQTEAREPERRGAVRRIERIAHDRVVNRFQVHAKLMRTTGFRMQFKQRERFPLFVRFADDFVARERLAQASARFRLRGS